MIAVASSAPIKPSSTIALVNCPKYLVSFCVESIVNPLPPIPLINTSVILGEENAFAIPAGPSTKNAAAPGSIVPVPPKNNPRPCDKAPAF